MTQIKYLMSRTKYTRSVILCPNISKQQLKPQNSVARTSLSTIQNFQAQSATISIKSSSWSGRCLFLFLQLTIGKQTSGSIYLTHPHLYSIFAGKQTALLDILLLYSFPYLLLVFLQVTSKATDEFEASDFPNQ